MKRLFNPPAGASLQLMPIIPRACSSVTNLEDTSFRQ